ncbi:hypothetical protein BH10PLA2_BH10PLA2_00220 [soil metagenome]
MSTDPIIVEMSRTLGRVDAKVEALLDRFDRHELDTKNRLTGVESRLSFLEGFKGKLLTLAGAVSLVVSCVWAVGGPYIQAAIFPSNAIASTKQR